MIKTALIAIASVCLIAPAAAPLFTHSAANQPRTIAKQGQSKHRGSGRLVNQIELYLAANRTSGRIG
jgi:hypothetical protein